MHFLQCLDASHELEGVMTRIVSTDIAVESTLLNQDTRSMVQQSKVGITRSVIDGTLVLEYEDMFTGKRWKLSRSQCLCPGRIEIAEARRFPSVLTPQIGPIGDLEGVSVMSTSRPPIGFLRTSTSGHAVVELTSSRIDPPPRRVGNRKSSYDNYGADVVLLRAEGISVDDLKRVGSRTFFLESTKVLMDIVAVSEGALQSESNRFCSHKARSRVDNDRFEDLVSAADLASMCGLKVFVDRREVLEERNVEVVLVVVCFLGTRLHSCASLFLKIRNPKSQSTNLAGSLDGAPIITQSRRHKPCSRSKYLTALIHSWHSMLLYYSQTASAIATATCDLRAVALLRCAVALLLLEAITQYLRNVHVQMLSPAMSSSDDAQFDLYVSYQSSC